MTTPATETSVTTTATTTSRTMERLLAAGRDQVLDADAFMNRRALRDIIRLAGEEGIALTAQVIPNAGGTFQFNLDGKPITNAIGVFPYHLTERAQNLAHTLAPTESVAITTPTTAVPPSAAVAEQPPVAADPAPAAPTQNQITMSPVADMRPYIEMGSRITHAAAGSDVAMIVERVLLGQTNGDGRISSTEATAALNRLQHEGKLAELTEALNTAGVTNGHAGEPTATTLTSSQPTRAETVTR